MYIHLHSGFFFQFFFAQQISNPKLDFHNKFQMVFISKNAVRLHL
jgi:hypothetical protein